LSPRILSWLMGFRFVVECCSCIRFVPLARTPCSESHNFTPLQRDACATSQCSLDAFILRSIRALVMGRPLLTELSRQRSRSSPHETARGNVRWRLTCSKAQVCLLRESSCAESRLALIAKCTKHNICCGPFALLLSQCGLKIWNTDTLSRTKVSTRSHGGARHFARLLAREEHADSEDCITVDSKDRATADSKNRATADSKTGLLRN
jgi:hypothetical protein